MYRIKKELTFDAAHFLPDHEGHCKNLHGHSYKVEVWIKGYTLNDMGMLIDFGELKSIIDLYDHSCLNEKPEFNIARGGQRPTAENMAKWFYFLLDTLCDGQENEVGVEKIRVWETDSAYAEYSKEW